MFLLQHVTMPQKFFGPQLLTTPYVVTAESTFATEYETTDSVSIDFDSGVVDPDATPVVGSNNDIMKMGADPIQLFLTVTD